MPADSEDGIGYIDLTSSPCPNTLPDHRNLIDDVIDLETIVNSESEQPRRRLTPRKRRPAMRPARRRATAISEPIHDLCTLDNRVEKEKKARKSKLLQGRTPDEPEEKRAKFGVVGCCSICLEEFGSKPLASTKCGHIFCHECIKVALKKRSVCPNCRQKLRGASAYHPIFLT